MFSRKKKLPQENFFIQKIKKKTKTNNMSEEFNKRNQIKTVETNLINVSIIFKNKKLFNSPASLHKMISKTIDNDDKYQRSNKKEFRWSIAPEGE